MRIFLHGTSCVVKGCCVCACSYARIYIYCLSVCLCLCLSAPVLRGPISDCVCQIGDFGFRVYLSFCWRPLFRPYSRLLVGTPGWHRLVGGVNYSPTPSSYTNHHRHRPMTQFLTRRRHTTTPHPTEHQPTARQKVAAYISSKSRHVSAADSSERRNFRTAYHLSCLMFAQP